MEEKAILNDKYNNSKEKYQKLKTICKNLTIYNYNQTKAYYGQLKLMLFMKMQEMTDQ